MSSWWYYRFDVSGDPALITELAAALPEMTYQNVDDQTIPLFHDVSEITLNEDAITAHVQSVRNYGNVVPLEVLADRYPALRFTGTYVQEQDIEGHYEFDFGVNAGICSHERIFLTQSDEADPLQILTTTVAAGDE